MAKKLLQSKLHELFLEDVKPYAEDIVNIGKKPLVLCQEKVQIKYNQFSLFM